LWFRTLLAAALIAALAGALALPACAQETVWTAVIPQGFPGNVYTWHLKPDGSYAETGRDRRTGAAVQPTLSGHWRMTGKHMVLRQDGIDYVFEGEILGDEYLGTVYLDTKRFSRFCAARGTAPPQTCAGMSA
jgi:hypothetical protein